MPAPKDPEKLAAYREKMRQIALARGYGKWMKGRHVAPETVEKMRLTQKALGNDPEERKRRSERAKAKGYGKWMVGRPANAGFMESRYARKGKTYEEIYGEERTEQERRSRKLGNELAKQGVRPPHLIQLQEEIAKQRAGKTYREIYGGSAEEELAKRRVGLRKHWEGKPKKADLRPKHNGDHHYTEWRKAVFERDDYTCQHCSQRGGQLQAHHLRSWSEYPTLRYEVQNGLTLCKECHILIHRRHEFAEENTDGAKKET